MPYKRTEDFEDCIARYGLEDRERKLVDKALRLFDANPKHPGLWLAKLEGWDGCYYIRAGLRLRLVYTLKDDTSFFWWAGPKPDFEKKFKN